MLPVKNNFKKGCKHDLICRFCKKETETQEHILQTCPAIRERCGQTIEYKEIFQENVEELKKAANFIIKITEELTKAEEYKKKWRQRSRTAWAPLMGVSHPADPGKCKTNNNNAPSLVLQSRTPTTKWAKIEHFAASTTGEHYHLNMLIHTSNSQNDYANYFN